MRRKWSVGSFILLAGVLFFYLFHAHSNASSPLTIGEEAPNFTLQNQDGEKIELADLRGKTVVLNFWTTWCPPCQEELPEIKQFATEVNESEVAVIGINLTSEEQSDEAVIEFIRRNDLDYMNLLDSKGIVGDLYQIVVIPTTFILDADGKIQEKVVGPVTKKQLQSMIR